MLINQFAERVDVVMNRTSKRNGRTLMAMMLMMIVDCVRITDTHGTLRRTFRNNWTSSIQATTVFVVCRWSNLIITMTTCFLFFSVELFNWQNENCKLKGEIHGFGVFVPIADGVVIVVHSKRHIKQQHI